MARRKGFTLLELMVVITVAGIMMMLAWPRVRQAMLKSNLRSARMTVVGLFGRARASAIQYNRATTLVFSGNNALVTAPKPVPVGGSTIDTIGAVENLAARYGATLTATVPSVTFDPRGFGANSGTVVVRVTREEFSDSVTITGFGRLVP